MTGSYDEFDRAMRKELELAVPTLFNACAVERGFESDGHGGYSIGAEDVPRVVTQVVLDAVLLVLRRYDEWTGYR